MTFLVVQAKNQVDGPSIDAGYYLADAFPANTTKDLPEALFVMEFGGKRKSSVAFDCKQVVRPDTRQSSRHPARHTFGIAGAVSSSIEQLASVYPVLGEVSATSVMFDLIRSDSSHDQTPVSEAHSAGFVPSIGQTRFAGSMLNDIRSRNIYIT